jgi:hypothetical protein
MPEPTQFPALIPCRTPGCPGIPKRLKPTVGLALIEHGIGRDDLTPLRLPCERCGRTAEYSYMDLLRMIPLDRRHQVLPLSERWVWSLMRTDMVLEDGSGVHLAERLRIDRFVRQKDSWDGVLLTPSVLAPALESGHRLRGVRLQGHFVATEMVASGDWRPLPWRRDMPQNAIFALVIELPDGRLQFENACCRNPACGWIFKLTRSEMQQAFKGLPREKAANARQILECPVCGAARVLDADTFDGWLPRSHPSFPPGWGDSVSEESYVLAMGRDRKHPPHVFTVSATREDGGWSMSGTERANKRSQRSITFGAIHSTSDFAFALLEAGRFVGLDANAVVLDELYEAYPELADDVARKIGTEPLTGSSAPRVRAKRDPIAEGAAPQSEAPPRPTSEAEALALRTVEALGIGQGETTYTQGQLRIAVEFALTPAYRRMASTPPTFDTVDAAERLGMVLGEYVSIHDVMLGGGLGNLLRRVIPLPGVFKPIDFQTPAIRLRMLTHVLRKIEKEIEAAAHGGEPLLVLMSTYANAVGAAIGELEGMAEKLAGRASGETTYTLQQHQVDSRRYAVAVDRYRALGIEMNRAFS